MREETEERIETEEQKLERLRKETNAQAQERISQELRETRKLDERRNAVMSMYFELTGIPMTEADFQIYNKCFESAQNGYNIKSFIRDQKVKIKEEVINGENNNGDNNTNA